MAERRFHVFQFNWGYVEDARIVPGPTFINKDGFPDARSALEAFRQILVKRTPMPRGCKDHGEINFGKTQYKFCPHCGKENQPFLWEPDVVKTFDSFWRMTNDEFGSNWFYDWNDREADFKWSGLWDLSPELNSPDKTLIFLGVNNYILGEEGGWYEAVSADETYSWSKDDDTPWYLEEE